MAKIRKFKDRRKHDQAQGGSASQGHPDPKETPTLLSGEELARKQRDQGEYFGCFVLTCSFTDSLSGCSFASSSTEPPSQTNQYAIRVPGVEQIMARVRARAQAAALQTAVPKISHGNFDSAYFRYATGAPLPRHLAMLMSTNIDSIRRSHGPVTPSQIELAGYSGLEDLPILDRMMKNAQVDRILRFYFRYNDFNCPTAVLLADPIPNSGKYAECDRNCYNGGHPAWLYVRSRGHVKWRRDMMAERGGMRQAVHLSRCEPGWRWEQQLGDLLDCRKSLNLWIQVKE